MTEKTGQQGSVLNADKRLFSVGGKHKSKMVKVTKQFNPVIA